MSIDPNIGDLSDEEVVKMVRAKNKELFSEIIHRFQTKLTHYLHKFIHDSDQLEDVLQDVFIKAFRNLHDFDANRRFSPWIYRIAHNEAINFINKAHNKSISLNEQEFEIVDKNFDIISKIDNKNIRSAVENALSTLKNKYRDPLILFLLEQKDYQEISEILRIPRNTVGIRIMRGRSKLKEILIKKHYER